MEFPTPNEVTKGVPGDERTKAKERPKEQTSEVASSDFWKGPLIPLPYIAHLCIFVCVM